MWKLFGVTIVKNGKNYCANESNLFFGQLFLYLKIYIIIFKYLSICKIEELIFFFYILSMKIIGSAKRFVVFIIVKFNSLVK